MRRSKMFKTLERLRKWEPKEEHEREKWGDPICESGCYKCALEAFIFALSQKIKEGETK